PLTPAEFRKRFASLAPQPFPGDRALAAGQIERELGSLRGKARAIWLSDGAGDTGASALGKALSALASDGAVEIYSDRPGTGPLATTKTPAGGGAIQVRAHKPEPAPRSGQVAAVTARGETLAAAPFQIPGQSHSAEAALALPLDLRNQVWRLE